VIRLVSIVTEDFWPGFAALLQSLGENSGWAVDEFQFTAICDVERAPREWLAARTERVELFPLQRLPAIAPLSAQTQGKRMENALQKLGVFALPSEWGKCVYVDCDMVCLGPMRELEAIEPFAAAGEVLAGFGVREPSTLDCEINTGLMVFKPGHGQFDDLRRTYEETHHLRRHKGDQDVINVWVKKREIHRLGSEWNFSKRFQESVGALWIKQHIGQVKLLHFVAAKPWESNRNIITAHECKYRWLEEIWWDYFEKSDFAAHMKRPPSRWTARCRAWLLPWTKPELLEEHAARIARFVQRRFSLSKDEELQ
jgi:lipopolysaccharide biosynthesis glycosyltransferase